MSRRFEDSGLVSWFLKEHLAITNQLSWCDFHPDDHISPILLSLQTLFIPVSWVLGCSEGEEQMGKAFKQVYQLKITLKGIWPPVWRLWCFRLLRNRNLLISILTNIFKKNTKPTILKIFLICWTKRAGFILPTHKRKAFRWLGFLNTLSACGGVSASSLSSGRGVGWGGKRSIMPLYTPIACVWAADFEKVKISLTYHGSP